MIAKSLILLCYTFVLFGTTTAFAQAVEINISGEGCSGFVAQLTKQSPKAYIFTAGHCIPGLVDTHEIAKVYIKTPISTSNSFFVYKLAEPNSILPIRVTKILFATFQKLDVAVLEISEDVVSLKSKGIIPLLIDRNKPAYPISVFLINSLKKEVANCSAEEQIFSLTYQFWNWSSMSRLSEECLLERGWSGAPVIEKTSGKVIGILSGGNETGTCDDYCEINNRGDKQSLKNRSYFTRMDFLSSCVNAVGEIDINDCLIK